MKWASTISERVSLNDALDECTIAINEQLGGQAPDLVLVFASLHHDSPDVSLAEALSARFPEAVLVGCMGAGIIGAGHEVENGPALSLTAAVMPGVTVTPFHVSTRQLPSPDAPPDDWAELLSTSLDAGPHFILLGDPASLDAEALLAGLDYAYPSSAKIGGFASGGRRGHALYLNGEVHREGAVGIAVSGDIVVDTVVAQGCRPIGQPMRITEVQHNMILTMDGETPLQLLSRLYETLSSRDQELVQRNLFMGVAMDPLLDEVRQGDFLIRNVVGIDPKRGALAVGALPREGQTVQFHVRDAETSSEDLRGTLSRYLATAGRDAEGALLFSCTGRGRYLYGRPDHDTGIFHEMVGVLPLGGFFCSGEIGPVAGTTYLHGYTSSFGIFRSRAGTG